MKKILTKSFTILLTVVTIAVLLFACEKKGCGMYLKCR